MISPPLDAVLVQLVADAVPVQTDIGVVPPPPDAVLVQPGAIPTPPDAVLVLLVAIPALLDILPMQSDKKGVHLVRTLTLLPDAMPRPLHLAPAQRPVLFAL